MKWLKYNNRFCLVLETRQINCQYGDQHGIYDEQPYEGSLTCYKVLHGQFKIFLMKNSEGNLCHVFDINPSRKTYSILIEADFGDEEVFIEKDVYDWIHNDFINPYW